MPRTLLELRGLRKEFPVHTPFRLVRRVPRVAVRAVDGVDLEVHEGEVVGLVGESGCGKSTVAWCISGLHQPTSGQIRFDGRPLGMRRDKTTRRRIQMVFQDPYSSLNLRMTVGQMLREVLRVHHMRPGNQIEARATEILHLVGLGVSALEAYPWQLSGGQRQRASIARALALEPDLLIADEPVSALDVSVQATIINLLQQLQRELGLTLLFIAHNLAVVRHISNRVAVMYLGRVVETAPTEVLFSDPRHPYTQGLLQAIPRLSPGPLPEKAAIAGELPSPLRLPTGCRFHPRCPIRADVCTRVDPALSTDGESSLHQAACHFAWASSARSATAP